MTDANSKPGEEGGAPRAPSLTLLIKLLKMTTSSHDNEALVAMRKANTELLKFGGDWDTLLRGKVTVIGDPFENLRKPDVGAPRPPAPHAPPPPPPPPRPQAPPPPQRPQAYAHSPQRPQTAALKRARARFKRGTVTLDDLI
jgi:hypothetical protein